MTTLAQAFADPDVGLRRHRPIFGWCGAVVLGVTAASQRQIEKEADHVFYIPDCCPMMLPSLAVIPLQLFAYYVSSMKGCDIDKPRNLAKSVTVE